MKKIKRLIILNIMILGLGLSCGWAHDPDSALIEAESFANKGGWKVDQQFCHTMGSPYLLAHGMGIPVDNAMTTVRFPKKGRYHIWVRTIDWAPGDWESPGRFQVIVDGRTIETVFGTQPGWNWQNGSTVDVARNDVVIELKDLTGFDGRCDAILFSMDSRAVPPNDLMEMTQWRRRLLGLPEVPPDAGDFDVVIVGGGIAGCAAALVADKQGLKAALIHDRPLLGGNASSEVRVHTLGVYGKGEEILKELDTRHWANGSAEAIPDTTKRHKTMVAARNVQTFLSWRAYAVNTQGSHIVSIDARHIESGETKRFKAPVFIDCSGDGWIGYWAGAEYRYGREGADAYGEAWDKHGDRWSPKVSDNLTMGSSLLWNSELSEEDVPFPEAPWALDVAKAHKAISGEWYWEFASDDKHQIDDAEHIRDYMLRAIYGSFYNAKKDPKNAKVRLKWVGYILGKRESRRLIGDYVYTMEDMVSRRHFPDTVVEEEREIDVHYQRESNGFLSRALYRKTGGAYYVPFRCLYSKNIDNLMMAGRCFSCSHIGLGGPRVMLTTGQMGIATGYAASLCKKYNASPRGVYEKHISELRELIGYERNTESRNLITSSFHGINWADARDNFVDGWIIPSGIDHNADTEEVAKEAREIITQFKNLLGVNTIRLGINHATVLDEKWWQKYRRIIKEAASLDMNVILACWEGKNNRNGKIDDKAEFDMMWDKVVDDFRNEPRVYFEIFNEPYGYSDQEWRNLAAAWIERQVKKIGNNDRARILVSGTGYSENLISIAGDLRFEGCLLSFHLYAWFGGKHRTVAGWQEEIEKRIGKTNSSRTIVTEWGAPMKNQPEDHYTKRLMDHNRECAYMTAMSNTIREWNMGSVYWPGLRDGDHFSLTEREGDSHHLKITNESGRILLQWSFNRK